ncbi:unnamed protein product [Alopecurus aequalis]
MYTNLHYHHQYEREHLFEKPLTPSDVGKLNRLVIPKQHAERYFPLNNGESPGEKDLLLSFEDESGKPWRFRYSYWTSSQSYVLTKGWSRYVKEKQLEAGDVVHFERVRGLGTGDRLFIGCRRRGESAPPPPVRAPLPALNAGEQQPWSPMCYSTTGSYPTSPANSYAYRRSVEQDHSDMLHAGIYRTQEQSTAIKCNETMYTHLTPLISGEFLQASRQERQTPRAAVWRRPDISGCLASTSTAVRSQRQKQRRQCTATPTRAPTPQWPRCQLTGAAHKMMTRSEAMLAGS